MAVAVLNHGMGVLKELTALPEQDEMTLARALVAAKAVDEACRWLMAEADSQALIARAAA